MMQKTDKPLELAKRYAGDFGWPIHPVNPEDDTPATDHGHNDATTSLAQVEYWWRKNPNYKIGVATGDISDGLVVIECKSGMDLIERWEKDNNTNLPITVTAASEDGKYLLFYKSALSYESNINTGLGVNIHANGSGVILDEDCWVYSPEDFDVKTITNPVKRFIEYCKKTEAVVFKSLRSAASLEEKPAEWFLPGIPDNQITLFVGDGGAGKTTVVCDVVASATTGKNSILTTDCPAEEMRSRTVLFLSGEDDFETVLRKKLRVAGADLDRVFTVPISDPIFPRINFNSQVLVDLVEECKPDLIVFDPIQQFVPEGVEMGRRNQMRKCLSVLVGFGKKYNVTSLIVCHTNKQKGVSARKRVSDSSDIWDIARSVFMVGDVEGDLKYLSHEKCNYGETQQTILFKREGDLAIFQGRSDKKDRYYQSRHDEPRPAPAKAEAKQIVIDTLMENNGSMRSSDLDTVLDGHGMSRSTRNRAKSELKQEKIIKYVKDDFNGEWLTSLTKFKHE